MGNATIQIDPEALLFIASIFDNITNDLSSIQAPPALQGGGKTVDQLVLLEEDFNAMRDAMITLITKTKEFLSQAAKDIIEKDARLANLYRMEK